MFTRVSRVSAWVFGAGVLLPVPALLAVGTALAEPKPQIKSLGLEPLEITATAITSFHRTGGSGIEGGKLSWRGGLVLSSNHKNFGGWSGLLLEPDGKRFLAISDAGSWMSGELTYNGPAPSGIAHAEIGPLLTTRGATLNRERDRDAEGLALESGNLSNGTVLVSFEQNTRVARYQFSRESGMSPALALLPLPEKAKKMKRNSGLEALTVIKAGPLKGARLAFSERMKDGAQNRIGWIWQDARAEQISLTDIGGYDISDVTSLDDGSIIVLERRFRWLEGLHIRLRKVSQDQLLSGHAAKGDILLEASLTSEIDNMEGLAASRGPNGETVLTLISDDNFNHTLQRTVLLQFALSNGIEEQASISDKTKARP